MTIQWPLVFFTLFIGLGSGTLALTGLLGILGKDKEIRIPGLITAFVAIVIGGCASVLHLQHFERIFNGFGNLTSGITWELVFIVVAVAVLALYFLLARKGETPKWIAVLALVAGLALAFFASMSYTMPSHPAWDSVLMYCFYVANALLMGAFAVLAIQGFKGAEVGFMAKIAAVFAAVQAVVNLGYGFFITTLDASFVDVGNYFDSTVPLDGMIDVSTIFSGFLTGENALLFWLVAIVIGTVIPLIAALVSLKKSGKPVAAFGTIALLCAIAGGIAFRVILYSVGYWFYIIF